MLPCSISRKSSKRTEVRDIVATCRTCRAEYVRRQMKYLPLPRTIRRRICNDRASLRAPSPVGGSKQAGCLNPKGTQSAKAWSCILMVLNGAHQHLPLGIIQRREIKKGAALSAQSMTKKSTSTRTVLKMITSRRTTKMIKIIGSCLLGL